MILPRLAPLRRLLVLVLLVLQSGGLWEAATAATATATATDGFAGADIVDRVMAFLNRAAPISAMGERTEFKWRALNDHSNDEIFNSSSQRIIERSGFEQVTYRVKAQDGYITELINIVNPLADRTQLKQPPVALFHGGLIDSSCFIWASAIQHHPERYPRSRDEDGPITSSNRSLAFMLANHGYDVWLVGTRGSNRRNLGHAVYETELLEDLLRKLWTEPTVDLANKFADTMNYFEFTQDELVKFEFPEQIDTILSLTNSAKLSAVTYSLATPVLFKLLASNRVHANKIHSHVALAPLLNNRGTSNMMKLAQSLVMNVPTPVGNLLITQVLLSDTARQLIAAMEPAHRYSWPAYLMALFAGASPKYQSFLELPVIGHSMLPLSFAMAKHHCQQMLAGQLQKYDYGAARNRLLYGGSDRPPVYNISNISLRRWMMVSADNDLLGTADSAEQYYKLHQHKPDLWVKLAKSSHADIAISFDNDIKVNLPILEFMEKFKLGTLESRIVEFD